jgi:DNA-binding NtrC family response regulator
MVAPPKNTNPNSLSILFADDEPSLQELMRLELPQMGHRVTVCPDGQTAVSALAHDTFDCLIVDLDMPGMSGIQVIERAHAIAPMAEPIVLTGKSSVESAVQALRFGATDYLTKPCKLSELAALLDRVAQRRELRRRMVALQRDSDGKPRDVPQLIGSHESMAKVQKLISKVAPTPSTALIRGETGCGKELVARSVRDLSLRHDQPFVSVNCGALPENLIESELFGHKKGAYTGADSDRDGLFAVANGGTIFLDEIGELPLAIQAKLLRVLESGEIRRVGDNVSFKVDVRVICATHRDLERMVQEGSFREDLLFRINTFEIRVPSLRERASDIPELARHLYLRCRPDLAERENLFAPETMAELQNHVWPGNVRELANVIEHATILCDSPPLLPEHLPRHFADRRLRREARQIGPISLRELEEVAIAEAIERHAGNKSAAAEELGISLKTLYNKLNQAEIKHRAG